MKNKENNKRIFKLVRPYLSFGFFFIDYRYNLIRKDWGFRVLSRWLFRRSPFTFVFPRKNKKSFQSLKFRKVSSKIIFFIDEWCLCVPFEESFYTVIKNNYVNCDNLPYCKAEIKRFDDERRILFVKKTNGVTFDDNIHSHIVLKYLCNKAFECLFDSRKGETIQHSDVKNDNIIWVDDNSFVFVDLDNVSFKPVLFDFFHYIASIARSANAVKLIFSKFEHIIDILFLYLGFSHCNIGTSAIDFFVHKHCLWYIANCPDLLNDYCFAFFLEEKFFPKTIDLLKNIKTATIYH